jgi:N-hydroxyarylamine O-acetyltransferase
MDVGEYLERIAYTGPVVPTAGTLAALHRAHMLAVPFENLDIHLGATNVLDPGHVYDKIVRRRRGGWCFELNGLFALLLERLGFAVTRYSAAVVASDPPFPDFAHLTLRVDLERPWLCDVGFGDSFTLPIRLDEPGDQPVEGHAYRLERAGERVTLLQDGRPQYAFELAPREMHEFAGMCTYLQTSSESFFTRSPICSLATENGRRSLSGMRLITTAGGVRSERELAGEAERAAVLRDLFGIDLGGATLLTDTGSAPAAARASSPP